MERGDVIAHESITLTCDRFDARVEVRPTAAGIKNHQRVRVHSGTAERHGRLMVLGPKLATGEVGIPPGESAYCQIAVTEPLAVMKGDRFILRDETAQRTIGGGSVILPAALRHARTGPGPAAGLAVLERDAAGDAEILSALLAACGELTLSLATLAERLNWREDEVRRAFDGVEGVHRFIADGTVHYASDADCRAIKADLLALLRRWHTEQPLVMGLELEEARTRLEANVPARILRQMVQELAEAAALVREGNRLRLPGHQAAIPAADAPLAGQITAMLGRQPMSPPDVKQLADELKIDRRRLVGLLRAMEQQRLVVCVAPDLYFLAEHLARTRNELVERLSANDSLTTAEFRDRYQTSRKYAIPLLEYFDRSGLTIRTGDVRRLRKSGTPR